MQRQSRVTHPDIAAAWSEVHEALDALPGWFVGRPAFEVRRDPPWSMYATDRFAGQKIGRRAREWMAIGPTELRVLQEMADALRAVSEGRVPK